MKRRTFLQQTSRAGLALATAPYIIPATRTEKYKLALIGSGWWGNNILREAIRHGNSKVVGICDVDERALDFTEAEISKESSDKPKRYKDYRELLEKEKPELVIIATPDHWHALPAIAALEMGAHVFCEKPIGHTINEGKAMLKAARENDRTMQIDTHRRVSPHNISAMEFLKSGKVGKISEVKCFINYGQGPGEPVPDQEAPKELDWDMWIGPAPYTAYNPKIHPKGFRQFLDYANGTIGDWGIHWFDQVLWWTEERYPKTVFSHGDRFVKQDNTTAPDTQNAIFEFETFNLTWQHKLCAPSANEEHNVGCYFYGTEGTLHLGWLDGWTFYPRSKNQAVVNVKPELHDPDKQNIKELWADFIDAIENKRRPVCDIEDGHLATNISLLGMISHKLGRSIEWDGEKEMVIKDKEANKLLSRKYRGEWEYPKV